MDDDDGRASVSELARMYRRLVAARIRSTWQYRGAFVLSTVVQLLSTGVGFVTVATLFTVTPSLGGWSLAQVGVLYGVAGLAFNLADTFVSQVELVSHHVREGTFDRFLLRPAPVLLQICGSEFAYRRINKVVQSVTVLAISLAAVHVRWTPRAAVVLVVAVAAGAVIYGSLWVLYSSAALWTVTTVEFQYAAITVGEVAARYPLDVLGPTLRTTFTALPISLVAYYPVSTALNRTAVGPLRGLGGWTSVAGVVVAAALSSAAFAVWRAGIARHQGTGS